MKRFIVMGGSFNPPTIAHKLLMQHAIEALGAERGIFVPVSDAYLKRKMSNSHPPVVLSPELRIAMLQSMCKDSNMSVSDIEIGTYAARTVPTMEALQQQYPDTMLYFVMGADKLRLLYHLIYKKKFLDRFGLILYAREGMDLDEIVRNNHVLASHTDRVVALRQPDGIDHISSSVVRERMLNGTSSQDMLTPGVWELFKDFTASDFPDTINTFSGEYDFLSNLYNCPFVWRGVMFQTAAAAISRAEFAHPDWKHFHMPIVESILRAKFGQNSDLMRRLKATGNSILINGNKGRETYWGVNLYTWKGQNHLGRLLMKIRDKKMTYNIETIKQLVHQNPSVEFLYFWGHTSWSNYITETCLSQWYDCYFEVDGVAYHTAEQYMMASKALLFSDEEVYREILACDNPRDYKKLGRKVRNFDPQLWDAHKYDIVVKGNKAKFSQNPELKAFLLSTGDAILVEASPYDRIWGIGMNRELAQRLPVEQWNGENLLGCALMEVRDWLQTL